MPSYAELIAQAESLMAQAEDLRKQERAAIIGEIREQMKLHGVTVADLGAPARAVKGRASKSANPPKYRSPNGEEWSGLGRPPRWAKEALEQGKSMSEFAI